MSAVASDELPLGASERTIGWLRPMPNWVFSPKFPLEARYLWIPLNLALKQRRMLQVFGW